MTVKMFEIRDRATFIPVMAVQMSHENDIESFLLRSAGFGDAEEPYVVLSKLTEIDSHWDPFHWRGGRTMSEAHRYIIKHWNILNTGDVIDVEYILKESVDPKPSERETILRGTHGR